MTEIKWEGVGTKLSSGHVVIETHDRGDGCSAWAMLNDSPSRCDPGTAREIRWLQRERTLDASTSHRPTVPVEVDGEAQSVPVDTPSLLLLSRMLHWTIADETRGHYYSVR